MPRLIAARTAQYGLVAEFLWTHNGWVVDSVDGTKKTLGSTVALSTDPLEPALNGPVANTISFDCIPLPPGAVIWGGSFIVETAVTGSTAYTVSLGIAGNTTALLNAQSALSTGRTALTLTTPLVANAGQNLRATIAYTVANSTAGRMRLRIDYSVDGRANEIVIT
jgi:hypothetical protein